MEHYFRDDFDNQRLELAGDREDMGQVLAEEMVQLGDDMGEDLQD